MIRLAKLKDIPQILEITKACARHMIANNIYQWNEHYPSAEAFQKDVARNELYAIEEDGEVIGTIVISTLMDDEYIPVKWLTPSENNIYIHRLAVHPKYQGKGYAQKLMDFAEALAQNNNNTSIRLDTFSQNPRNQRFYEQRGYQRLGNIYFPKQSEYPFYCYEKIID